MKHALVVVALSSLSLLRGLPLFLFSDVARSLSHTSAMLLRATAIRPTSTPRLAAARGAKQVYLHAFLDGRDMPPRSAGPSLEKADALFAELGCGRTDTVCGRYYAMDRDNRWDRIESAYALLTEGASQYRADSSSDALAAAYQRG